MFQHILVPLDGSQRAEQALPVAARIARSTGGSVLLVRVVNPPIDYSGGLAPVSLADGRVVEDEIKSATDYLNGLVATDLLAGVESKVKALFGIPVQQIEEAAALEQADLIIIGSHGRTGFTRWALGSVAYTLAHESSVPILILRQYEEAAVLPLIAAGGQVRTLVPLDGSELAETALLPAAQLTAALAGRGEGALHLAQVVKIFPATVGEGFVSELNEEALRRAEEYLAHVEKRLHMEQQDLHLSYTHSVDLAKDTAASLKKLAEHEKVGKEHEQTQAGDEYDLIAMSTHGRSGLERWVMGSVTDRLLQTTKLPMLIVRPPKH